MAGQKFATDYIDVAARIVEFRGKFPEGSLQPADLAVPYRVETIGAETFIVVVAAAYRSPDDHRPGVGMAYEVFPGKTNFTRGSELQNAETSAWGRAIVASLAADTKQGIASAEEVRNRREEQAAPPQVIAARSDADLARDRVLAYAKATGVAPAGLMAEFEKRHKEDIRKSENAAAINALVDEYERVAA